jgi:hypothetical protein
MVCFHDINAGSEVVFGRVAGENRDVETGADEAVRDYRPEALCSPHWERVNCARGTGAGEYTHSCDRYSLDSRYAELPVYTLYEFL